MRRTIALRYSCIPRFRSLGNLYPRGPVRMFISQQRRAQEPLGDHTIERNDPASARALRRGPDGIIPFFGFGVAAEEPCRRPSLASVAAEEPCRRPSSASVAAEEPCRCLSSASVAAGGALPVPFFRLRWQRGRPITFSRVGFRSPNSRVFDPASSFSVFFRGFVSPLASPFGVSLPDFDLPDFDLSDFDIDFDLSDFDLSDFDLSDFDLSDFDLSDFDLSDFDLSDFDLSDFDLSDFGLIRLWLIRLWLI